MLIHLRIAAPHRFATSLARPGSTLGVVGRFMALVGGLVVALLSPQLSAGESDTMAGRSLRQLVVRQQELLAEAAKNDAHFDENNFQMQMEQVCRGYEELLRANPKLASGYAAYGYLLSKLDQKKQSVAMLLKANQLDPDQPLVKNQIGNYLAEDGKPLDALPYYLAAIKLTPTEPLYHYQLGTLLSEARDDFLKSGEWKRDAIEGAIHTAFGEAARLAPERIEFTYRFAESFYEMETPDWDGALKAWSQLEEKAPTTVERETMRLHQANIWFKRGSPEQAKKILEGVTDPALQKQKEKLVAQLAAAVNK